MSRCGKCKMQCFNKISCIYLIKFLMNWKKRLVLSCVKCGVLQTCAAFSWQQLHCTSRWTGFQPPMTINLAGNKDVTLQYDKSTCLKEIYTQTHP